jgi:serine/threonine-protein kinase
MRLGKYQLLRKLATGGMAEVFLAKTDGPMGFEKLMVIKRILPHLAEDPQFVDMFLAEAKLAAQLNHPNLVQLFDFGEAEGSYFIAMEYIDGPTLRLLLARARDLRTPITLGLAARIVSAAAEGLAYAHDFRDHVTDEPLHLVHRDVSPDNILVSRSGGVKLVDFGIAKARGQSHHTQAGTVKGKVAYMAPEQLRGEPLDRRVDLYGLGVVLYELCTGQMPFEAGSDASMVRAVLYDAAIPAVRRVPTLPAAIQSILDRLLAKDRNARYPDCRTLHADLEAFIPSTRETTNGFALSRLVAQLAPPAPPAQSTPPRPTAIPPGVTASAFAPTSSSPILLSEPLPGQGRASRVAPLEILDLDRTVRSEGRRTPPPVAGLEVRTVTAPASAASPSAFVFPTALETERGSVTPVRIGLERGDRRTRTTGTVRRVRGGGGPLRAVGLVMLLAGLAALGGYLGLAAAHRTDLLARVGLPVPPALAPAATPTAPAAPVTATPAPAAAGTVASTGAAGPGTTTAAAPASASPTPRAAAPGSPAPVATGPGVASPPAGAPPSTPAPTPPSTAATPGHAAVAGTITSATPGSTSPSSASPGSTPPARPSSTGTSVPGSGAGTARGASAGPELATAAGAAAAGKRAGAVTSEPATSGKSATESPADTARRPPRETDREKLLGAFADLETAKESTVVLESTPKMKVRMGGKILGTTPVKLTIPAQDAPVDLEFFDTTQGLSKPEQLTLKPGDNGTHKVEIPKRKLVLKLQDGVEVTVDGKAVGTAPLAPLLLWEGKHVVQLTLGDQKERRTLEISGDEPTELEFDFPEAE